MQNKTVKAALVMFTFVCCMVAGFIQNLSSVPRIPPQTAGHLTCASPLSSNKEIFNVYLTEYSMAEMALPLLCNNSVIKKQYGNVVVTVGRNDFDTFRFINHGVPELTLVKSNVVLAFAAGQIYHYQDIAAHHDYKVYFIALREKPILNKEYLLGKRIGLLDYPSSRSGHIVPKTVLQQLGLNDTNTQIRYFNSHQELRAALMSGEVDLISSYWAKGDEKNLSRNYITSLQSSVPGMRWYLKMQTNNTDLRCALQDVIRVISKNHPLKYYHDVEIIGDCSGS